MEKRCTLLRFRAHRGQNHSNTRNGCLRKRTRGLSWQTRLECSDFARIDDPLRSTFLSPIREIFKSGACVFVRAAAFSFYLHNSSRNCNSTRKLRLICGLTVQSTRGKVKKLSDRVSLHKSSPRGEGIRFPTISHVFVYYYYYYDNVWSNRRDFDS